MELVFNEISFLPHGNNDVVLKEQFINMLKLFEKTKTDYGYRHLVFPSNIIETKVTLEKTFFQWANSISHPGEKNKILSVVKRPFGNDVLEEQVRELNKYYYVNNELGIEEYCIGLATSFLKQKIAISLPNANCWDTSKIIFKEIVNNDLETKDISVINITNEVHLIDKDVKNELMYAGNLELEKCPIKPEDKTIKLSGDHHGNDKLEIFSKKLFRNDYVVKVINNIDYSPKAVNLIKTIYPDGKIDLVLYWETPKCGMIIQTTGKNRRETEEIAKLLKKEFDK